MAVFKKYKVLSKRELESRYEVFLEQYAIKINIEAETAAAIARTMILPAAVRYLNELKATGLDELIGEVEPLVKELHFALRKLEDANLDENQPDDSPQKWAVYMRDTVIPAMDDVRDVADRLESSSPTTSGRCRSTRRCCSSSDAGVGAATSAWAASRRPALVARGDRRESRMRRPLRSSAVATLITFVGGGPTATQLVEEDAEVVAAAIRSGREDTCRFTLRGGEVLSSTPSTSPSGTPTGVQARRPRGAPDGSPAPASAVPPSGRPRAAPGGRARRRHSMDPCATTAKRSAAGSSSTTAAWAPRSSSST